MSEGKFALSVLNTFEKLLRQEPGVTEIGYRAMLNVDFGELAPRAASLFRQVECTDGGYYIAQPTVREMCDAIVAAADAGDIDGALAVLCKWAWDADYDSDGQLMFYTGIYDQEDNG